MNIVRAALLTLFFLYISFEGLTQSAVQISDKKVRRHLISGYFAGRLTKKLTKNCNGEYEKVQAISSWITKNIRYDVKSYLKLSDKKYRPNRILRRRKAICSGYSDLFVAMCSKAGIKAYVVEGYGKGADYKPGEKFYFDLHKWNTVYIDSSYYLFDLTWASGHLAERKQYFRRFLYKTFHIGYVANKIKYVKKYDPDYIMISEDRCIEDHLPCHPMWQLKEIPVSIHQFEKPGGEQNEGKDSIDFLYQIKQYTEISAVDRRLHIAEVSKRSNPSNNKHKAFAYGAVGLAGKKAADFVYKKSSSGISSYAFLLNYFDTTFVYLKKFQTDNALINKIKQDTIDKRHGTIYGFDVSELNTNNATSKDNIRTSIVLKRNNIITDKQAEKSIINNERATNVSIAYERRPGKESIKSVQRIKENKTKIAANNRMVDSLYKVLQDVNKKTDHVVDSTSVLFGKICGTYLMRQLCIKKISSDIIHNEDFSKIKYEQMMMDSMTLLKRDLKKQIGKIERTSMTKYAHMRDSINRVIVRLISSNRSMIRNIKRASVKDENEDEFFYEENSRLLSAMNKSLEKLAQNIYLNDLKIQRLKTENRFIKLENKGLKRQIALENLWNAVANKREKYRFENYRNKGLILERNCHKAAEDLKFKLNKLKRNIKTV